MSAGFSVHRGESVRPAFATSHRPPRRRAGGRVGREPVTVLTVPAAAMRIARELAGGDVSWLRPQRDGSVVVVNRR